LTEKSLDTTTLLRSWPAECCKLKIEGYLRLATNVKQMAKKFGMHGLQHCFE